MYDDITINALITKISYLEKKVENLENLVGALIKRIDNDRYYANADTSALRQTDGTQAQGIEKNTADIDYIMIMEDL